MLNRKPSDYYVASHRDCLQGDNVLQDILSVHSFSSYQSHDKL